MKLKEYIQQEVKKQLLKEVSVDDQDDFEEDHNLEMLIFSHLSNVGEGNPKLRQTMNFIKSLVSELADGKKRLSDKEVKKLTDKYF